MILNVIRIHDGFLIRSHCVDCLALSTRGMILVVSNVVTPFVGVTRGAITHSSLLAHCRGVYLLRIFV